MVTVFATREYGMTQ